MVHKHIYIDIPIHCTFKLFSVYSYMHPSIPKPDFKLQEQNNRYLMKTQTIFGTPSKRYMPK